MYHYVYTDNSTHQVLFECDDEMITKADIKFTTATGIDPVKSPWIGCQVLCPSSSE